MIATIATFVQHSSERKIFANYFNENNSLKENKGNLPQDFVHTEQELLK
jgi:hypothetical protein